MGTNDHTRRIKNNRIYFITYSQPPRTIFFGALAIAMGLILGSEVLIAGLFPVLFGLWLITFKTGVRFRVEEGLYKSYASFIGIEFGTWQKLPAEKFLLLKRLSDSANYASIIGDFTDRIYYYKIFLKSNNPKLSLELMADLEEGFALTEAKELAALFGVELKMDMGKKRP